MNTPIALQRANEYSRLAVDGRLVEGGGQCTFLVIHERGGNWAFYPQGAPKLGLWLPEANAVAVARAILVGVDSIAKKCPSCGDTQIEAYRRVFGWR
ncbi:MAG: hypothetical protein ACRDTC_15595 [Pseudonocardiaceae bacterium]